MRQRLLHEARQRRRRNHPSPLESVLLDKGTPRRALLPPGEGGAKPFRTKFPLPPRGGWSAPPPTPTPLRMAFPLRSFSKALQTTAAHPRAFSSSTAASTSKLSPLNKTVLARAKRDAKGDGKGKAKKSKEQDMMTLEEAARVLKVSSPRCFSVRGSRGASCRGAEVRSGEIFVSDIRSWEEMVPRAQLEEARRPFHPDPHADLALSSLGVVPHDPQRSLRDQHPHQTRLHDPTQRPPRPRLPPPLGLVPH